MAEAVHAELGQYREEQEREHRELLSMQNRSEAAERRASKLQQVLSKPLRPMSRADSVSRARIWSGSLPTISTRMAAAPATCGAAIEVPS